MFSGIVTDIGCVEDIIPINQGLRLNIFTRYEVGSLEIGSSIACSGICLTVTECAQKPENRNWFVVEAWKEALKLTNLTQWTRGTYVNLERSLRLGDKMDGHLVFGHIDGLADIVGQKNEGDAIRFSLQVPIRLAPFIAEKGSVALNGTSLTVNCIKNNIFDILLIHRTLKVTTWGHSKIGDQVNLEIDQLARYVARFSHFKVKDEGVSSSRTFL